MSKPFDLAWALLKGISSKDAIEWIRHYQSQHEEGSEEWWNAENRIDAMGGGYYHSPGLRRKWGPPPAEYAEYEPQPPPGFKPLTPEQRAKYDITLERIDPNQE